MRPRSRGASRPSFARKLPALQGEGARKTGCALHPRSHVRRAQKNAHEHTGSAESIRPSLRNGFTAYDVLSPENGSFASVAPWEIERLPEALTPAPRRRDHTLLPYASCTFAWHTPRPPHPAPRSLRSRAPLLPGGTG